MFLILLIVLAISIYMRNSYFVEGIENMFKKDGDQFDGFILPEYSQTAPLIQLTETIFYDKKNGNIVEAVVEWTSTEPEPEPEPAMDDIANTIEGYITDIASETDSSGTKETIQEKVTDKISLLLASDIPAKEKNDITDSKDAIIDNITDLIIEIIEIRDNTGTLPDDILERIKTILPEIQSFTNIEGNANMGSETPTLNKLIITPCGGADSFIYEFTQPLSNPLPTQESLIDIIDTTCTTWSYVSQSKFAPETTVFYIPWKNDTYISIYEKSEDDKMTSRGVFHFSKEKQSVINVEDVEITNSTNTQDDNNNKYVKDEKYGEHDLYQVDKFILYDIPTSNLIVRKENDAGSITIYNGEGKEIDSEAVKKMYDDNKTHENQEKYAELKAWTALDGQGENIITYIKNVDKTLVFVCGFESNAMDSLVLKNVRRFTLYGMDNCEKVEKPTSSEKEETKSECDKKKDEKEETKSEDYILKTQIVPPVCPTCPMCPKDVTCTNCGGNGGSGTKASNGKSVVGDTVGEVTDLARDATSGAADLGRDAVGGAVDLGRDAVGGVVDLGREIVGGATGLVRDVTGGATGLVRDVTGGAFGLVRDAGSGVAGILTPEQQRQQQLGYGTGRMAYQQTGGNGGQYYGTNNNMDRYGALPERPSNYIPRTANFSAFA